MRIHVYSYISHNTLKIKLGLFVLFAATFLYPISVWAYPVTVEVETMPIKTTGSSIPKGWNIRSNGYIATNYNFTQGGSYSFDVVARGTSANGAWPKMELRIGQVAVGSVSVTTTGYYSTYLFVVNNISGGVHKVAIAFTNDYYNPPANRDLFVDKVIIAYNPPGLTPTPIPVLSPSPLSYVACKGTPVYPTTDLRALVQSSPFGTATTYCIKAGTHYVRGPIIPRSGDSFIGEPGAVLDGTVTNGFSQAFAGFCVPNAQNYQDNVTIRGLVIKNFNGDPSDPNKSAAVKAGCNWTIEYNEISDNREIGVKVDRGTILRRNNIHHNGRYGLTATPSMNANILIQENEIAYNNTRNLDPNHDAGGSKLVGFTVGLTGVKWIRNWVHHNKGNGIWHDLGVGPDIEVAYNTVEYNTGSGIFVELSWGHEVHDNFVRFNGGEYAGLDCFWGSQIHNNNSSDVNVYRNYAESLDGSNGICLVSAVRSEIGPYPTIVTNSTVYNNTIKVKGIGMSGLVGDNGQPHNLDDTHFEYNTYYVPDLSGSWAFDNYPLSVQQWQAIGHDIYGRFLTW